MVIRIVSLALLWVGRGPAQDGGERGEVSDADAAGAEESATADQALSTQLVRIQSSNGTCRLMWNRMARSGQKTGACSVWHRVTTSNGKTAICRGSVMSGNTSLPRCLRAVPSASAAEPPRILRLTRPALQYAWTLRPDGRIQDIGSGLVMTREADGSVRMRPVANHAAQLWKLIH